MCVQSVKSFPIRSTACMVSPLLIVLSSSSFGQNLRTADFNDDGAIEFIDFYTYTLNADIAINQGGEFDAGDFNGDGLFNLFDGFAFNSQWNDADSSILPAETPFENELSLIVDDFGNMWVWGMRKPHPGDRKLLMGYSIRSLSGSLIAPQGLPNVFRSFARTTEFEVIAAETLRFRVDGPRALKTKVEPVDLADLTFRYGSAEGVFTSEVYPSVPGDADMDGAVEFSDFLALSEHFGRAGQWEHGDFTGNALVGFEDFIILSTNFGEELDGFRTQNAAIPEPNSRFLLGVAFCLLSHGCCQRRSRRNFAY